MKESDLYLPLKRYLEGQGYVVKGEVHDCDVVAVKGDEPPLLLELKLALNLELLLQAVDRLAVSPTVYVCVPRHLRMLGNRSRGRVVKLMRMLGLGLIAVDLKTQAKHVEVIAEPGEYRPRKSKQRQRRLLGEFNARVGDPNLGGSATSRGRVTVYRQRALAIAKHLLASGPQKASDIAKVLGDPKARDLLYDDVYKWFERHGGGVYALSARGEREFPDWLDAG